MPNSPVSLDMIESAKAYECDRWRGEGDGAESDEEFFTGIYLAREAVRPREQVEGLAGATPIERLYAIADDADPLGLVTVQAGDLRALTGEHRCLAALSQPSPTVAVEGLVERVCNSLDKMIERWVQGEQPTDEEGKEATEALMALTRRMPAISQPSSPEVIRAPDGLDESHYRGRAEGVPVLSNEDAKK